MRSRRQSTKKGPMLWALHVLMVVATVLGWPSLGEAQVELRDEILSGARLREESLDRERIPAELKEIPRRYFERITDQ